jgi:ABC-type transport system involved in multi-copper enzyme maturation permease subunit
MTLITRVLRDDVLKVSAYFLILLGNALATVLAWPTFEQNYQSLLAFVPSFLKGLKTAIAGASGGIEGFVAINHLFKGANVLGAAMAVFLASGTIAREVEIGTAGMLLSRPWSRARVLLSFAAVHLAELIVPLLLATLAIPLLGAMLIDEEIAMEPLLLGAFHAASFIALVYALALALAVGASEQLKVAGIAGGICVVSFLLYFFDATRPYSLFRFSSLETYSALARREPFDLGLSAIVLGSTAIVFTIAWLRFRRRDF